MTITKSEATALLAAHLAFEERGGDRSDEWQAGYEEFSFPCMSLRLSQLRHAEQGTAPRKAKYIAGAWDQREYALPNGDSPQDVLIEVFCGGNRSDFFNADAEDITWMLEILIDGDQF